MFPKTPGAGEDLTLSVTVYRYKRSGFLTNPVGHFELVARDPKGRAVWMALDQVKSTQSLAESLADSVAESLAESPSDSLADSLADGGTTRMFLEEILPLFSPGAPMEVETYTWSVLPSDLRTESLTDSICREIRWVQGVLA